FDDDDVLGVLSLELSYDVMMIGKAYVDHGRKQVQAKKVMRGLRHRCGSTSRY
ncbi:hypothetical protein Tco_1572745, partial [Tanacetum coccineum]